MMTQLETIIVIMIAGQVVINIWLVLRSTKNTQGILILNESMLETLDLIKTNVKLIKEVKATADFCKKKIDEAVECP